MCDACVIPDRLVVATSDVMVTTTRFNFNNDTNMETIKDRTTTRNPAPSSTVEAWCESIPPTPLSTQCGGALWECTRQQWSGNKGTAQWLVDIALAHTGGASTSVQQSMARFMCYCFAPNSRVCVFTFSSRFVVYKAVQTACKYWFPDTLPTAKTTHYSVRCRSRIEVSLAHWVVKYTNNSMQRKRR